MATSAENPCAMLTKWIANLEQHKKHLEKETADVVKQLENLKGRMVATDTWLNKFNDLLNTLESSNKRSLDILEREADASFTSELRTHFERIQAFLKSKSNEPQTIAEIEEGTKIPRTSISAVLYRTHNDKFVEDYAQGKRGKVWALKSENTDADQSALTSALEILLSTRSSAPEEKTNESPPLPPPPGSGEIPF